MRKTLTANRNLAYIVCVHPFCAWCSSLNCYSAASFVDDPYMPCQQSNTGTEAFKEKIHQEALHSRRRVAGKFASRDARWGRV